MIMILIQYQTTAWLTIYIWEKWVVLIQEILCSIYLKYRTRIYQIRHTISIQNILFHTKLAASIQLLIYHILLPSFSHVIEAADILSWIWNQALRTFIKFNSVWIFYLSQNNMKKFGINNRVCKWSWQNYTFR